MSLVPSLLQAIVTLDGEACVIHVGDKPYVVAPSGQIDLATRGLTFEAVNGILEQLLPVETLNALDEFGAIQYELPAIPEFRYERFTVVAARGGEDVWVEIRRKRAPEEDRVPIETFATREPIAAHDPESMRGEDLSMPDSADLWPDEAQTPSETPLHDDAFDIPMPAAAEEIHLPASIEIDQPPRPSLYAVPRLEPEPGRPEQETPIAPAAQYTPPPAQYTPPPVQYTPPPTQYTPPPVQYAPPPVQYAPPPVQYAPPPVQYTPPPVLERAEPAQPAVVLPLSRNPVRGDAPPPLTGSFSGTGLDRLLRIAAARGASTLYLASLAKPSIRVDGEIQMLDEAALGPSDVEALLIDLMPERNREALRSGVGTEWICDVPEVGRVRCMTFRDHRGAGGIFRMMPVRAISADQLGLSREIQALAAEPEGLVLVAGPRSSGKSTLISAFVDLINRTRRDHVITIESEIKIVHENRNSLVSQREVRGDAEEMLAVARAAIRENPDVLVIEELRTADMVTVALDAANSGHLVIGALPAHTASGAVDRIIDLYQPEFRRHVQLALAENLRGIVAQVLVRKPGGGRVAAREVLLNTSAVASVIAEGKTSQLPMAIEGGRKHGMLPLNDSLVGFVQSGTIDAREAYRRAADRTGFLALLKRQGIDISFAERLA
jgi:twitching motility protein PilT